MSQTYYSTITDVGAALISNAPLLGTKVDIVQIAVGDANGTPYRPSPTMTALKHETWRGAVTQYVKESNNIIIVHGVIPASVGGFVIREVAILDDEGNTIAIGNTPDLPKVTVEEGFNFDLELRMRIIVTNAEVIEFKINPHVTIATMADVNLKANKLIPADVGNLACLDETGNLADAGVTWKDISTTMATKAITTHNTVSDDDLLAWADAQTVAGGFFVNGQITPSGTPVRGGSYHGYLTISTGLGKTLEVWHNNSAKWTLSRDSNGWFENGKWTPLATATSGVWTPTGTNIAISNITKANWKKNGTHVQAELECDFKKSGTEAITIGGLPFAAAQRGICLANAWELALNQGSILTPGYVIGTNARLCIWFTTDQKMYDLRGEGIATTDVKPVQLVFDYEAVS